MDAGCTHPWQSQHQACPRENVGTVVSVYQVCPRESVETLVSVTWMLDVVLYISISKWMSDLYKEK